jgi:hypothetical protein
VPVLIEAGRRGTALVAVVAVLVFGAAACGGGGKHALTKAAFTGQADALCASASAEGSRAAQAKDYKKSLAVLDTLVSKLEALAPPSDLQNGYGKFLTVLKAAQTKIDATGGDPSKVQAISSQLGKLAGESSKDASAIGLGGCATAISG